jgi:nucleotide-binding universal stress UspA family protein
VNEHLNSEIAARYAIEFAKSANARIFFCSIAPKGIAEKDFETATEAVKRLSAHAEVLGLRTDTVLATGKPVDQVDKIVTSEKINLVFAATRHEDVEKRFYARTTARLLSLRLPCSVALVRVVNLGRLRPQTILVPLKARIDHIDERAGFTALMAGAFGSRICLFHITKPSTQFFARETPLIQVGGKENGLPGDIKRFIQQLQKGNVDLEKKLMFGAAGRTITIEAAAKRHDMIIMGASERSLLSSFVQENPVERVMRETTCDLIILKPRLP